jgi:hypothetical protein
MRRWQQTTRGPLARVTVAPSEDGGELIYGLITASSGGKAECRLDDAALNQAE